MAQASKRIMIRHKTHEIFPVVTRVLSILTTGATIKNIERMNSKERVYLNG